MAVGGGKGFAASEDRRACHSTFGDPFLQSPKLFSRHAQVERGGYATVEHGLQVAPCGGYDGLPRVNCRPVDVYMQVDQARNQGVVTAIDDALEIPWKHRACSAERADFSVFEDDIDGTLNRSLLGEDVHIGDQCGDRLFFDNDQGC